MKKIYSFILLFPLLLVSCGEGNIDPSTSPSEEESYKLIVNCPGHEDESYENKSGDDLNPSHPSRIIILMAGTIKKLEES